MPSIYRFRDSTKLPFPVLRVTIFRRTKGDRQMFHRGNRELQRQFGSTTLADRLVEKNNRACFTESDKNFVEQLSFFFLATSSPDGKPDCSFKGGHLGFIRVPEPNCLMFPDYDGNGMFKSLGNIRANPNVGLLFIEMGNSPKRLRVNGTASVELESPLLSEFEGAQAIIQVTPTHIFPNCPRYIPDLENGKNSKYLPDDNSIPIEPAWKDNEFFKHVIPERKR